MIYVKQQYPIRLYLEVSSEQVCKSHRASHVVPVCSQGDEYDGVVVVVVFGGGGVGDGGGDSDDDELGKYIAPTS